MFGKVCGSLLGLVVVVVISYVYGSEDEQTSQATFTAAVYEHRVFNQRNPEEIVTKDEADSWSMKNIRVYREQARLAAQKGADIIVFPENGIHGYDKTRASIKPYLEEIPNPENPSNDSLIICEDVTLDRPVSILKSLSCIAKENRIYLVANMAEVLMCDNSSDSNCPPDGAFHYDTNVIFDKSGKLLAKYHKKYLYWQPMFDSPNKPEVVIIPTPFGVLGTFVAGDIFYQSPALDIVEKHGVDTVVMTTTWDNTFPYPKAIAVQEGYAIRMRVNLLAANTHAAKYKISGSGLYGTSGAFAYHYSTQNERGRLLLATLPAKPRAQAPRVPPPWVEDNPRVKGDTFQTKISGNIVNCMPLKHLEGRVRVCQRGFCCTLSYSFRKQNQMELFVFGVFNGLHKELISMYTQTCAVFKCASVKHKSCGKAPVSSSSIIGEFRMWGTFSDGVYVFPYVTTSGPNGTSLSSKDFDFSENVLHSARGLRHPLLSAILFGRFYARDSSTDPPYETVPPNKNHNGGAVFVTVSTSAIFLVFVLTFRFAHK